MKTKWSFSIDPAHVLEEYPRPQLVRTSYLCLNGMWDYAFTDSEDVPTRFDGQILVPFSPESELSGVMRELLPFQCLWYSRRFTLPKQFNQGRVFLHFGAVDQYARVIVNGTEICEHMGGYLPFSVEITSVLREENELQVMVRDWSDTSYHARGKQKTKRGGIWYTRQSGIWQTVWLESTPVDYISDLEITPLPDSGELELTVYTEREARCQVVLPGARQTIATNVPQRLKVDCPLWSPENPVLNEFFVILGEDMVSSYFAMRKVSVEPDANGVPRVFLNGKPYFQTGLLDQGYWPESLYTPPSDEAMIYDIQTAKNLGFNMLRKHIKIEPLRWYYHCDRLGMLVWQDMVCGGGRYGRLASLPPVLSRFPLKDSHYRIFGRSSRAGRLEYEQELAETVKTLRNFPCIVVWVPFNEGWGQFDALRITEKLRQLDPSRLIDHASGWHDQGGGDFFSLHVYWKEYKFRCDQKGRAVALTEFGGYSLKVENHCFNETEFGYKRFRNRFELTDGLEKLYFGQILPARRKGLSACVYTQLTDVEDELNGILTYDRDQLKIDAESMLRINRSLRDEIST